MAKPLFFFAIFLVGEILLNLTFFRYLRQYFEIDSDPEEIPKKFLGLNISIFKGILERFLIFFALTINLPHVLILFGAIKIGTRL